MASIWDGLKNAFGRDSDSESTENEETKSGAVAPAGEPAPVDSDQVRMVECVKLGRTLPGLEQPPFPGELGQRVYENVSVYAYEMWQEHQTLVINHYGLNLADPRARQIMMQEMEAFLFENEAEVPDDWIPES